jgi:hypothetical protein
MFSEFFCYCVLWELDKFEAESGDAQMFEKQRETREQLDARGVFNPCGRKGHLSF